MAETIYAPAFIQTVPQLSGGKWADLTNERTGEVYNPSTGQSDRHRAVRHGRTDRQRGRGCRCGAAGLERNASRRAGTIDVPLSRAAGATLRRAGGSRDPRARQDAGRGPGRGESRHRSCRIRLRHSEPDHGRNTAEHCGRRRCRSRSPSGWRVRWHHAVQLPVHGAAVDVSDCAHLRQHICAEAVGKSAAVVGATRRTAWPRRACRTACSTSCMATRNVSMRCSIIPKVAAISFVGSTPIAKYIYERGTAAGKRVQSAGGAKNHLIIMPDADMDQTVKAARRIGVRLCGPALHGRQCGGRGRQGWRSRRGRAGRLRRQVAGRSDGWQRRRRHGARDPGRASR